MDGVLVLDKPQGLTSHDVVAVVRRALHERRIGHTGTLDPLATGVLPMACGRATRLVRFLSAAEKEYDATILFGVTTDSYDITGIETSRTSSMPRREAVVAALDSLRGEYLQVPPSFSAKKIDGQRAYALARRAEPVTLTAVTVRVPALELVEFDRDRCSVRLTCSAGFYVRSFAHALGERVGTGACLEALRRTRSGDFGLDVAVSVDELLAGSAEGPGGMLPIDTLLPQFPSVVVTDEGRARISHGREIGAREIVGDAPGPVAWVRILDEGGALLAMGIPGAVQGSLHPEVVLI
ncbi:MAG: tRNA pseudouridine(55) synthase TruB [Vicinamibacterales bacterium]